MNDQWLTVLHGDCRAVLPTLEAESVNCVVTSPPFWGLRDYGTATWEGGAPDCKHEGDRRWYTQSGAGQGSGEAFSEAGPANAERLKKARWREAGSCVKCGALHQDSQIGLEPTPEEYVETMVGVFREVRRLLRSDGTVWLNLGDSYNSSGGHTQIEDDGRANRAERSKMKGANAPGLKPKDLVGIPWRVAFALQADGWYLRSDIIWSKPNPMPESVTDRPTKSHEYVFLLTKSPRYWYDADAVRETSVSTWNAAEAWSAREAMTSPEIALGADLVRQRTRGFGTHHTDEDRNQRNLRSVWTIATQPYPGAHFATFPPKLVEPCILAGCPEKCCVDCGAPWERVVERGESDYARLGKMNGKDFDRPDSVPGMAGNTRTATGVVPSLKPRTALTTGWRPTCAHDAATRPGVVLEYIEQLEQRNNQTPLGLSVA